MIRLSLLSLLLGTTLLVLPVLADVVHLTNGSMLEGHVRERPDEVRIEMRYGSVTIPRRDVAFIHYRQTPEQRYVERLKGMDRSDPAQLYEMARWAERAGLPERAVELTELARSIRLERRLSEVAPADAEGLYELALWVRMEDYPSSVHEYLLERVVRIAPDHGAARYALGQERYNGQWMTRSEIAAQQEREFENRMQARGLVKYNGRWVDPDDAALFERRAALESTLYREQAELELERQLLEEELADLERRLADGTVGRAVVDGEEIYYPRQSHRIYVEPGQRRTRHRGSHRHREREVCDDDRSPIAVVGTRFGRTNNRGRWAPDFQPNQPSVAQPPRTAMPPTTAQPPRTALPRAFGGNIPRAFGNKPVTTGGFLKGGR